MTRAASALRIAIAALLALSAACGVRTDPRPPEDTAARPPDKFRVKTVEGGVELRWERVTKSMDGGKLYDLASFHVERRTGGAHFETIAKIPVTDTDRIRTQQVFQYLDAAPPAGTLEYRVRAVAADGEHGVPTEALSPSAATSSDGDGGDARDEHSQPPAPRDATAPGARDERSAPPPPHE